MIIITGASGGIGAGFARGAAREGALVVVASTSIEKSEKVARSIVDSGGIAIAISVDVSSEDSCRSMAASVKAAFGGIDGLVNNAAMFGTLEAAPLLSCDLDYYLKVMAVNMHGALIATRSCYRMMAERGGGSVVNVSSTAAYMNGAYFYGVSKAGVNGLTKALSPELGVYNIRINGIAPGPVSTDATLSRLPEEKLNGFVSSMSLKRMGQVDDLVGACLFLLSEESSWMTSQTLIIDGGMVSRY